MKAFTQDPGEKLDYRQTVSGDTVASATWTISPATGVTLDNQADAAGYTMIRVSGLTLATKYTLTCHIVGTSGQEYERSVWIVAGER
jgi:hypothetical protein